MLTKQKVPEKLNYAPWPYFETDEIEAVSQVLASGKVNYWTGEEGKAFEKEFAHFVGSEYAIALMNGTVALEAALRALGITAGDEVITTSRTFIASASAVVMLGATPIFADVDPRSQNITAETIATVITPRTKAIIAVHLAGWPCEMDAITELAVKHQLVVIEDCAQAHGARYKGRPVGAWGDIAAFSFCQDKIMTTGGEGGMITTQRKDLWEKIWAYKDHGKSYAAVYETIHPPGFRWLHDNFGTNFRMTEMQAALGRLQLKKLPLWLDIRRRNASILQNTLQDIDAVRVPYPEDDIFHAYYKFYVFLNLEKMDKSREQIMQAISEQGVPCYSGSCSEVYLEKAFINANLQPEGRLPVAKHLGETSLMFLVHPTLSEIEMESMATRIKKVLEAASL